MSSFAKQIIRNTNTYDEIIKSLESGQTPLCIQGMFETLSSHVMSALIENHKGQSLIICSSSSEAKKTMEDLETFFDKRLFYMPKRELVFFDTYAHSKQNLNERAVALNHMLNKNDLILVTSIDHILTPMMPKNAFKKQAMILEVGETLDLEAFMLKMSLWGYDKVGLVEQKSQYAQRGSIIDFYLPSQEQPIRMELFDDEIDSIRFFDPLSQKSTEKIESITVFPSREFILTEEAIEQGIKTFRKMIKTSDSEAEINHLKALIDDLEEGVYTDSLDKYHPFFFNKPSTVLDYFKTEPLIIMPEIGRIKEKATRFSEDFSERYKVYLEKPEALHETYNSLLSYDRLLESIKKKPVVVMSNLRKPIEDFNLSQIVEFKSREAATYHGKITALAADLKRWLNSGHKVLITASTEERGERIKKGIEEAGIYVNTDEEPLVTGQVKIEITHQRVGYELSAAKFMMFTEHELFGVNKRKKTSKKFKDGQAIKSFRDLTAGDYVVHENHGIGKYVGLEQLVIENTKRDYLKIHYQKDDFLYIPIEQMDLVQKYTGAEGKAVKVNKLNSTEWQKTKRQAKKVIEDMTDELLALYADRGKAVGFSFSPDTDWQKQFEDMFPYEETPDQLKCIDEIKADMESSSPMDRLLCGDVGFGKTEVAIRAIFKAVNDNKQAVVLVPTTILAQQHFNTMSTRMSKYPVRVEMLSRFRTKKQQEQTLENLRTGVCDVVIGTHRVLSQDVLFKDLGLLVVDEEQRFGVKHKERIKQLKTHVDILTLTATPIPRTLHMSMVGIRDMSVIEDPPEERYPIQTYVAENDPYMVKDVIERELERSGQVYYVHNRVEDIDLVAGKIINMVPDARVVYAHGQMGERKLEKIMMGFMNHEYDVLVCTTIIETGLDISNANTMIIDSADKMGLSQLYQLKGRIGRSNRLAYAYLTYKKDKVLSEVAEKRLKAIKEFTELGAGFKIAMRDLEIRGAGNLLGSQQHGHIAAIGYDLYCKMLEIQVNKVKGIPIEEDLEVSIDFKISAYIDTRYVTEQAYKLELYKKISAIRHQDDAYAIEEEIEDRYGNLPQEVRNLIGVSYMKALARRARIKDVQDKKDRCIMTFAEPENLDLKWIQEISVIYNRKVKFEFAKDAKMIFNYPKGCVKADDRLKLLTEFLLNINNMKVK